MMGSKIEARFKRVYSEAFFWLIVTMARQRRARAWLALVLGGLALQVLPGVVAPAQAQGSRKDDIVFNSRGIPLAGATVRVCTMPASGQPCTPLALIYSDSALTQALANPTTSDGLGNYHFYAAPGKYMIEISGPGITTKQIPDVIIPVDPTSPTFSGNISAFSLNLSGNLTVNGNTTVLGNLASGTLNLTNQSTPPGAAGAGTVNLYTKSSDDRLYYKDQNGVEIGPLGPGNGAQTNVSNTFTAAQNIDSDFHTKGPNPWFDVSRFGGYAGSNTPPTITCGTTSGSNSMTCSGGVSDFQVGHGVAIPTAGAAPTVLTPGTPVSISSMSISSNVATIFTANAVSFTIGSNVIIAGASDGTLNGTFSVVSWGGYNTGTVNLTHANCSPCNFSGATVVAQTPGAVTPLGILNGSTTWNYKVVAADFSGGLSAASAAYTTTAGAASLGLTSAAIANNGCVRSGGVLTITTTAAHNFQNGAEVNILRGSTNDNSVEGAFVINSVPTGTTFTILQTGKPDITTCSTGGTAQVVARNLVQWTMQPGATVMQSYIYRSQGAGAYSLVGITQGQDSSFTDWGQNAPTALSYIPSTSPSSPTNGILSSSITAINGTTVTLAANAGATVASATVKHDNTANVLSACNASAVGGTIFFPISSSPSTNPYVFNSPLPLTGCPQGIRLLLAAPLLLNEPVLSRNTLEIEGLTQGNGGQIASFLTDHAALITGNAYPFFLLTPGQGSSVTFSNLNEECNQPYQSCTVQDQDNTGNNVVDIYYRNVYMQGTVGAQPFKMGGGFGFYWDRGAFAVAGATHWGFPPIFQDSVNYGLGNNSQQLGGLIEMRKMWISGGEMLVDGNNGGLAATFSHVTIDRLLNESSYYPTLRIAGTASETPFDISITDHAYADNLGGFSTPIIDLTTAPSVSNFEIKNTGCANGFQPLFAAQASTGISLVTNGVQGCSGGLGLGTYIANYNNFANVPVTTSGTKGELSYAMPVPAAPIVTVGAHSSCVSNCLAAGTYFYSIIANDINGGTSGLSPGSAGATTDGTQTVTVSWTPVGGQVSTTRCRGTSSLATSHLCADVIGTGISGTSYTDASSMFYTVSILGLGGGGASSISAAGMTSSQLNVTGSGFKDALSGAFTANRTQTLPDVNGVVPVSSYLNSAYDNATRANGAIGTNWTVENGGINIASNTFQGATASTHNTALWSLNVFSPAGDFSELMVTALNGATDFIGPTMLTGANGYDCIENSTTLFLQKLTANLGTNLTSVAITGAPGDVLRLEYSQGGALTCYRNGTVALTANDSTYTSLAPGLDLFGNVATAKNWSGGNLHPLAQLDVEQDWTKPQHFTQGVAFGTEAFTASPRAEQSAFLPGALTSTWTGSTWTLDKAVTVTRVQIQAKTAPSACATNAVVRLTDGTSPVNLTISAAANDSGPITQNYAAGAALTISVQTAAAGCTTSPADANVIVQYRMQ